MSVVGRGAGRLVRAAGLVLVSLHAIGAAASSATPAGWVEWAAIGPDALRVAAKLDTGADNSSLHAESATVFQRGGGRWIRFAVTGARGTRRTWELPVVRTANVKRKGQSAQAREVVRLGVCIGTVRREVEVTLADRSGFEHPLLVGRSFLAGSFLVDSARTHVQPERCTAPRP